MSGILHKPYTEILFVRLSREDRDLVAKDAVAQGLSSEAEWVRQRIHEYFHRGSAGSRKKS